MRSPWKSVVMVAALALFLGIAAPSWSQDGSLPAPQDSLADPMEESYSVHVIPFYKIDQNWYSFLVVADTSFQVLAVANPTGGAPGGTRIFMNFYDVDCNLQSDAIVRPTKADSQLFALHDPAAAEGQFAGIPSEGVILLDGAGSRFLTYILLINTNNNSMIRIDSIPCQGPLVLVNPADPASVRVPTQCQREATRGDSINPSLRGTWLRYDTYNTVAATFGHSGIFETWLYFFSAPPPKSSGGITPDNLNNDLLRYGKPRHGWLAPTSGNVGAWARSIHVDAWCDEIYLGSRRRDLKCTERVPLSDLNYSRLAEFPDDNCAGSPGHIETYASDNGTDLVEKDYSGFQETIAELIQGVNMIGTGYMHHSEDTNRRPLRVGPSGTEEP
jgi:hypothetical protein